MCEKSAGRGKRRDRRVCAKSVKPNCLRGGSHKPTNMAHARVRRLFTPVNAKISPLETTTHVSHTMLAVLIASSAALRQHRGPPATVRMCASATASTALSSLLDVSDKYDAFLLDQFGVIHGVCLFTALLATKLRRNVTTPRLPHTSFAPRLDAQMARQRMRAPSRR